MIAVNINPTCADCSYSVDFVKNLQKDVQKALAKVINKENSSRKLDLNLSTNKIDYLKLSSYNSILNHVLNCSTCNFGYTIDQIVSLVKNRIDALS